MEDKISFHESQIVYAFNFPKMFERSDLIKKLTAYRFKEIPEPEIIKKMKLIDTAIVSNELGEKNNSIVFYDEHNKVLGVKGTNFRDVFLVFQELENLLDTEFDVDFGEVVNFIEGATTIQVKTDNNAKKMIKDYLDNYNRFDKIFGEKTYLSTIRIIPEDKNISDRVWFDMLIEPFLSNPKKYFIRFVFRDSDIIKFKTYADNINSYVSGVIDTIEGGIRN